MEWVGVDNQLAEGAYKKANEMLQSFSLAFSTAALSPWLLGHVYTIAPAMQQWPPLLVKLLILTIYAYAAAAYSLFVLRWARPGWARFMLSAPVVAAHLSVGLWVTVSRHVVAHARLYI